MASGLGRRLVASKGQPDHPGIGSFRVQLNFDYFPSIGLGLFLCSPARSLLHPALPPPAPSPAIAIACQHPISEYDPFKLRKYLFNSFFRKASGPSSF